MFIKDINLYNKDLVGRVDAIQIANKDHVLEFSAIVQENDHYLMVEDVYGKSLYDLYQNLTEENSTHARVMNTGTPVVNEEQILIKHNGQAFAINTSTFPLVNNGEIIGTIDFSFDLVPRNDRSIREERRGLYNISRIISESKKIQDIIDKLPRIAETDSPVMVVGESGVGKELIVESIHTESRRAGKPFISLNCAAIPYSLMESTLFGTVKGSFTGAENLKGAFELANGGTLFLDELNSLNVDLQAKLLKVVEEQRYMKIGGSKYTDVDVRIISAMNVVPEEAISQNMLRRDLYYRLGVIQVDVPPLRSRREDVMPLTEHFIGIINRKNKKAISGIDEEVRDLFMTYPWPGNVRELRNVLEQATILKDDGEIGAGDLSGAIRDWKNGEITTVAAIPEGGLKEAVAAFEKQLIENTLSESSSLSETSRKLKMTRQAIKYKIEKYDIKYRQLL